MDIPLFIFLIVNDLDESGFIITRCLETVKIHHCSGNICQPTIRQITPEPNSLCQTRAANSNRYLDKWWEKQKSNISNSLHADALSVGRQREE